MVEKPSEFHASMITAFKTCPRMYYYQYVEGLVPKAEPVKLSLGRGVHIALAALYSEGSVDAARAAYSLWVNAEVPRLAAEHPNPSELEEAAELGAAMLEAYYAFAEENDDFAPLVIEGRRAVEVSFRVPVWSPKSKQVWGVRYVGTFDGLVKDYYGRVWLLEHKTASSFPAETLLRLDEQTGLYLLAAVQLFKVQPAGVIYNVIRKVDPRRARGDVVKRWKIVRDGHELVYMSDRLYHAVKAMRREQAFMPSPGQHCTWKCAYTQLCVCDHDGSDSTLLKKTFYVQTTDGRRPNTEYQQEEGV